jgi:hypothetical protein
MGVGVRKKGGNGMVSFDKFYCQQLSTSEALTALKIRVLSPLAGWWLGAGDEIGFFGVSGG